MTHTDYKLNPDQFKILRVVGEGTFGEVRKCLKRDTREIMAAKLPKNIASAKNEMMRRLMDLKLDCQYIVKFFGWFNLVNINKCVLMFEMLDMNLEQYCERFSPLPLTEIKTAIIQLATALEVLKFIAIIHTDIHIYNIMLVDHRLEPLTFKLIDYGLAISSSKVEAELGNSLQPNDYRSPEIILGLPVSEAIDVWSLGIVTAYMISKSLLFEGKDEYETFASMIYTLGQPPDHLLNNGLHTGRYFTYTESKTWTIKEFFNNKPSHGFSFQSVDQLKDFLLEDDEDADVSECEQCVQLVKAMLTMDGAERISPKEILSHSFIIGTPRQESPTAASRGDDDSQVDRPSVKTLKESDDGDVKTH
ncbi:homeodomain-interacting protein kinase 2-like isoform X2 [Nelusetta ayraudi]|uniref:homeodomain-interacting protein kinase 2-like isoform X2 n=1 Tax=Nelusetta ayraudi TaxID=303726 RepID=UPI003F70ED8E